MGPMFQYGLLGGEFFKIERNKFSIKINTSNETCKTYEKTISTEKKSTFVGLPEEYVDAVRDGIELYRSTCVTSGGVLNINVAAHNAYGSSNYIFSKLSYTLIALMQIDDINLISTDFLESCLK